MIGGGLSHPPQTLDRGQYFALTSFKLHEIWRVLILRKISEIVDNRCHILTLKCTKFDFGWVSAQTQLGKLTALPRLPSGFKVTYF